MSSSRFQTKFAEQLRYLNSSATLFDNGDEVEAIRLATSLRVLLHDTRSGVSLFTHTGRKGESLLSSSRGFGDWRDYLGHRIDLASPDPIRMTALLGDHFREVPVQEWWDGEVVFVHDGVDYTRKRIILSAADKDGGAHVDARLEEYYEVLQAGEYALGITGALSFRGPAPFEQGVTIYPKNAHFALLRQFAHEVLSSAKRAGWM